ncbi:MAG: hypothetical protein ACYC36_09330 [Bellilinea sp.]
MHRIRGGLLLLIALILLVSPSTALAQNYSFEVPVQNVSVFVNSDGTLSLDYAITFANEPNADPIDIVDVGMPNYDYELYSISATIDGAPVDRIADSEYVSPGVEFHLGSNAIRPGQSGTLRVQVGVVRNALGPGSQEEAEPYASLVFTPSWFDSSLVRGKTNYTFSIILPPGIEPEQPRYHTPSGNWPGADEPASSYDDQNRVVYTWTADNADASTIYEFGVSFPMALVPAEVVVATETPNSRSISIDTLFPFLCFGLITAFIVWGGIAGAKAAEKRKLQYMPPKIAVEGHGIKRGLTAVEAAILMEQPLDKVMSMILFSVLKKGAATVVTREPLKLEVVSPLPENLQPHEVDFCKAFETEDKAARRRELQSVTVGLVKSISEKMKGFSRKETIAYYTAIMEKAWAQVTAADTPEVKSETYEQVMEWTMLDKEWSGRTQQSFGPQPVFVPTWWWRFDPAMRPSGGGGGMAAASLPSMPSTSQGGSINLPKLPGSDFAASMVNGAQEFSASVVGNLTSFTDTITNKTNPVPKTTYTRSGGSGGGGRSCACACACAGCACACAGGGR